jgi:outer membrane protein OmpA-like peptidoglycan-associated protein
MILLGATQSLAAATTKKNASPKEWKGANRNIHHIAIWGGAGYSGLVNGFENNRFIGGGGGLLGVGYEYKYDHFILHAGPEFRIFSSQDNITFSTPYDVAMMADGYHQTKHYTFTSTMRENHVIGQVMLPVMVGGKWDKWYFLAGAKLGYTVLGNYTQKSTITTTITDHDAYDPVWSDMVNHGAVTDAPYASKGKNNYGFDVTLSAEAGVNINGLLSQEWNERNRARQYPLFMRAGIFVDYGLMNLAKAPEGPMAIVDESTVTTRSLHTSEWANGRMNSLLVGIKFTALLQMNKPQPPKLQKPAMMIQVSDEQTNKAIASAAVDITPKEGKKPRSTHRTTNKNGMVILKTAAGSYNIHVTHPDYTTIDHDYSHGEWGDTLTLAMTPRPDFRFHVRDAKSDSLLASDVTFINTANEALVASAHTDSLTGFASLRLPLNTGLRIHIEAANHLSLTVPVNDIGGQEIYRLEPIVKKRAIILHNLFFATNQTTILPESESALQDLYDLLNENPEIRIRITGHTDNVGSDKANQRLSEGRANSVRNDLIKRGIAGNRIEAEGKGESQPIDTNDTEEGRQNNRRVEFMIL